MAGDVIKEFLVSLGFRVEANQEKKFTAAVGSATNAVVALGAAAAAASAAVSAAVIKISRSFDGLYWQAQRTQTTVSQIKAMSYAVSQLGGSADEAGSSIESFGKHLKWNPGFEGFLKQIGVVTRSNGQLRDSVALMKDFASVLKGKSRAEQMGLAQFAGIDLKTLEALQNGDLAKRMAEHSATLKRLGVDEDDAARKANALQIALGQLNNTLAGIGTLLLDRFGPSLTQFFEKLNTFIVDNSDKIVQFFEKLGRVAGELYEVFEKLLGVVGPLWQKFDNLTQSIAGVDGLTTALVALIGLKVSGWLLGVAAAITKVGTAASVALLGGALGKFLAIFGIGYGAYSALESQQDFNRRADAIERPGGRNPFDAIDAKAPKDSRNIWQRNMPKWLGGKDAPAAAPGVQPSGTGGKTNGHFTKENADAIRAAAKELGTSPEDLATVIGYETGGTFSPSIRGGAGNRHIGLIQFGQAEQRQYGASQDQSFPEQMKAVVRYLKDRGFKPGMSLVDLYSTINAGRPGLHHRSDAGNGGAPGTVADKVRTMGPHAARARLFLGSGADPATPAAGSAPAGAAEAYRQKTGRDLKADLASSDPHVRKWAGVQAGLPADGNGDDKQNWSRYGNAGTGDQEGEKRKGDANLARIREQMANEDLQKAQTILDVTGFEEELAKADRNAAKATGGGLGDPSAALAPPPASTAGTTVTVNQENHVNITGSGDPHDTAQQIGQTQRDVNGGLVRDLKGAVR